MTLESMGGRRFLISIGCGAVTAVLCWYGKVSGEVYATVVLGTIGGYITGNIWQRKIDAKKGKRVNLDKIISDAYLPAIELMGIVDSQKAQVMLLAIGLQESRFLYRRQMGNGPARSFWQFERGGGVKGVLTHAASKAKALHLCDALGYAPDAMTAWTEMEHDDVLGAGFARLLLLTDPRPLPAIDDEQGAWEYYFRNWRPGKPHRDTWNALHAQAVQATV